MAFTAALLLSTSGCTDLVDALATHARPVAKVAGEELGTDELATMMASSPVPDSALTGNWATQIGRLWIDYVSLVNLYRLSDTTAALDYDPLLRDARYYSAIAVQRYRDSVVLAGLVPTDEELRRWFDDEQPLTRLDIRRVRLDIPRGASRAQRDSVLARTRELRERVVGGADIIELARAASDEPAAARGQVLAYQGHADFHPAADSVVFELQPGEVSPVIELDDAIVFYRVEARRVPEFESAKPLLLDALTSRRREARLAEATDSLLLNSRRVVVDGAEAIARLVANSVDMAQDRVSGSVRLVHYDGGAFSVSELRELFHARPDIRTRFQEADDEELGIFLYSLAGDEILIRTATESGIVPSEEVRADLRANIGGQLASIAERLDISHRLVTHPDFDVAAESQRFIQRVLEHARPVPVATEFRPLLERRFPSRIDHRSAEVAARQAREIRGLNDGLLVESETHAAPEPEARGPQGRLNGSSPEGQTGTERQE